MKLKSTKWLRFGLVGGIVGIFGIFMAILAISDEKISSATSGVVSVAEVSTAVGIEMDTSDFNLDVSTASATTSAARTIAAYTNSSNGLTLSAKAKTDLTLKDSTETFDAASGTTLAKMEDGAWGYSFSTGSGCGNNYLGFTTAGDTLASSAKAGTASVNLCIGAKGSIGKTAGTYSGSFTLSVTANAEPVRYNIVYMDYDEASGATVLSSETVSESTASHEFTLITATKTGYTLTGWKKDNSGDTLAGGAAVTLQSSAPTAYYYAVWTPESSGGGV